METHIEGWEPKAAEIALEAYKKREHYGELSEVIYQGVKSLLQQQEKESYEKGYADCARNHINLNPHNDEK